MLSCGEASPIFSHVNANVSVLIDRIRNRFQEMNNDNDLDLHSMHDKLLLCRIRDKQMLTLRK